MEFRSKGFTAILLASLAGFTGLIYYSLTSGKVQSMPEAAEKGKIVYQKKACVECHTVFGNGGYSGGDLTKIYETVGSRTVLKDYLTHPPVLSDAKTKRHDQVSAEEADEIIDYLIFLNSVNTGNWPPKPLYKANMDHQE